MVLRKLIRARSRRSCTGIVELSTHYQGPRTIQTLLRIRSAAHPCSSDRRFLGCIGEQLILTIPTFVVSLRSERTCRVVDQFQITFVSRHLGLHVRLDVEEHLVRRRGDHTHRTIAHADWCAEGDDVAGSSSSAEIDGRSRSRQNRFSLGDHGFQQLD